MRRGYRYAHSGDEVHKAILLTFAGYIDIIWDYTPEYILKPEDETMIVSFA